MELLARELQMRRAKIKLVLGSSGGRVGVIVFWVIETSPAGNTIMTTLILLYH